MWLEIIAPHFCACVALKNGMVVETAPILKYMRGWTQTKVLNYSRVKGWTCK